MPEPAGLAAAGGFPARQAALRHRTGPNPGFLHRTAGQKGMINE